MASLQCDIHALTSREDVQVRDTDFSAFKYQEKTGSSPRDGRPYAHDKISFATSRGQVVRLENKRPTRLRSNLRELEEAMAEQSVVWCRWRSPTLFQLVLTSGLVASLWVNRLGDLERVVLDKWLIGKLGDHVTDLQFTGKVLAVAYLEAKVTIVSFGRPGEGRGESLASQEPRLTTVELPGPPGRRLDRKLEVSADSSQLLVWWSTGGQEVFPWAPSLREEDRANLAVIGINPQPHLTACSRISGEPLYCRFLQDNTLHCLAQSQAGGSRRGETQLENSILALEHGKHLRRKVARTVIVPNVVICHALVPLSDSVLLGTVDGAIFTFDQVENRVDNQVKASFTASTLVCHPEGAVFLALSEKGLVQCFDAALTPVQLCFPNEEQVTSTVLDLSGYFRSGLSLRGGAWAPPASLSSTTASETSMAFNFFLLRWQGGPLAVIRLNAGVYTGGRLGPLQIVAQYLKLHLYHQVLLFLNQVSWTYSGQVLIFCLATAFNAFIKLPYSREKECLLEMCLGVFHTPSRPIAEEVREEHGEAVRDLTRRFFHHLVRHNQLVKGFQLAVDINDYDLFMDIHHAAVRRSVPDLAHAALIKAKAAYNRLDSDSGSRATSRQSGLAGPSPLGPSPMALFTAEADPASRERIEGGERSEETMQPGRTATFLRTTAAKKISTNQFRQGDLEDSLAIMSKSLKYESIVNLPQPPLIIPMQTPANTSQASGDQHPYVSSTAQPTQQTFPAQATLGLPAVSLPSFLGPGSASAQSNLGVPATSLAANNLPSSPYIFRSSNQPDSRQLLGGTADFDQPFMARPRSEEGKTRLEEEEEENENREEGEGRGVAELIREMEASHIRLPGGYQQAPLGAYHLAPLPSGNFQSIPSSYQLSPSTYHPDQSLHKSNLASYQPSPSSFHPSSTAHPGSSESYQPLSPPSYQPPPSISKHQQQQEDIKVIHFGVV